MKKTISTKLFESVSSVIGYGQKNINAKTFKFTLRRYFISVPTVLFAVGMIFIASSCEIKILADDKPADIPASVKAIAEAMRATLKGDLKEFQQLIRKNPELLKFKTDDDNITLLHLAAEELKAVEILKYLIENNVDVNQEDKKERTPLFYAALAKNNEAILYLIMNEAKLPDPKLGALPKDFEKMMAQQIYKAEMAGGSYTADYMQDQLFELRRQTQDQYIKAMKNITNALNSKPTKEEREKYRLKKVNEKK
ncbi:MAG: ankyrin repeat domain-containing protein [Planctomycetaceae bacterium]|jgi:ankyrin repeat protein|nr:ankyrin repeat domain-containing protein [Planctomycetaceae bacterium]